MKRTPLLVGAVGVAALCAVANPRRYDRKLWIVEPVTPAAYRPG